MEDILDNIGPIVVGVIYFLGWLFNKKAKADESTSEPLEDHDFKEEEEEYQRNVQSRNSTQPITETGKQNSFRSVRSNLKDPKVARSAFIYGEVLGPPVSLRKGSGVPGLTS